MSAGLGGTNQGSGTAGAMSTGCAVPGPIVMLTDPASAQTYETCTGRISATYFLNALCACHDATFGSSLETHGFDSSRGAYQPGQTDDSGASVGINDSYALPTGSADVGGSLSLAGPGSPLPVGSLQVRGDLRVAQNAVVAGSVSVARNAWLGGTFIALGAFTIAGELHHQGNVAALPLLAQSNLSEAVSIQNPCACETRDLLDIGRLVDDAQTNNDNAKASITSSALASITGSTNLTLPCGRFYLDQIQGTGDVMIEATGAVALFVGGSIDLQGSLNVQLSPGAEIDVFVRQDLRVTGQTIVGSMKRPAASRIYVGGSGDIALNGSLVGNLYAPGARVSSAGALEVWGSIFCGSFVGSADSAFVYDRSVLAAGSSCETTQPPAGACSKCGWCSGGTACIDGSCGPCRTDNDCCSQSVCANGSCAALVVVL